MSGITKKGDVCNRMSKSNLCAQHNPDRESPKIARGRSIDRKRQLSVDSSHYSKSQRQSHSITPPSSPSPSPSFLSNNVILPSSTSPLFSAIPLHLPPKQEEIVFPSGIYTIIIQSDPRKADMLLDSIKYHNGNVSRREGEADSVCAFFSQTPIAHVPIYTTLVLPTLTLHFTQFASSDENYVVSIQKSTSVDDATLSFKMDTNFYCKPNRTTNTISLVPIRGNE